MTLIAETETTLAQVLNYQELSKSRLFCVRSAPMAQNHQSTIELSSMPSNLHESNILLTFTNSVVELENNICQSDDRNTCSLHSSQVSPVTASSDAIEQNLMRKVENANFDEVDTENISLSRVYFSQHTATSTICANRSPSKTQKVDCLLRGSNGCDKDYSRKRQCQRSAYDVETRGRRKNVAPLNSTFKPRRPQGLFNKNVRGNRNDRKKSSSIATEKYVYFLQESTQAGRKKTEDEYVTATPQHVRQMILARDLVARAQGAKIRQKLCAVECRASPNTMQVTADNEGRVFVNVVDNAKNEHRTLGAGNDSSYQTTSIVKDGQEGCIPSGPGNTVMMMNPSLHHEVIGAQKQTVEGSDIDRARLIRQPIGTCNIPNEFMAMTTVAQPAVTRHSTVVSGVNDSTLPLEYSQTDKDKVGQELLIMQKSKNPEELKSILAETADNNSQENWSSDSVDDHTQFTKAPKYVRHLYEQEVHGGQEIQCENKYGKCQDISDRVSSSSDKRVSSGPGNPSETCLSPVVSDEHTTCVPTNNTGVKETPITSRLVKDGYEMNDSVRLNNVPTILTEKKLQPTTTMVNTSGRQVNTITLTKDNLSGTSSDSTNGRYKCGWPACTKTFVHYSFLVHHKRLHTVERPYVCTWPGCSRQFRRSDDYQRHYRVHSGAKPYLCNVCGKGFKRSDHRLFHYRSVHKLKI